MVNTTKQYATTTDNIWKVSSAVTINKLTYIWARSEEDAIQKYYNGHNVIAVKNEIDSESLETCHPCPDFNKEQT